MLSSSRIRRTTTQTMKQSSTNNKQQVMIKNQQQQHRYYNHHESTTITLFMMSSTTTSFVTRMMMILFVFFCFDYHSHQYYQKQVSAYSIGNVPQTTTTRGGGGLISSISSTTTFITTKQNNKMILYSSSSSPNLNEQRTTTNTRNMDPNNMNKKKKTNNNKNTKSSKRFGAPRTKQTLVSTKRGSFSGERMVLINNDNDNNDTNQQQRIQYERQYTDNINCQHYYYQQGPEPQEEELEADTDNTNINKNNPQSLLCSGCTTMQGIGNPLNIPILKSAQYFFSTPSILRHCFIKKTTLNDNNNNNSRTSRSTNNNNNNSNNNMYLPYQQQKFYRTNNDNDMNNNNNNAADSFYQVVVPSAIRGWRTQAKLVVANRIGSSSSTTGSTSSTNNKWSSKNRGCVFGLYSRGTHVVVPIPNCEVHHPLINQAVHYLEIATQRAGIGAFDENEIRHLNNDNNPNGQLLRYVQLQVERCTGQVCCTLVFYSRDLKNTQPGLSRLIKEMNLLTATTSTTSTDENGNNKEQQKPFWHSIWCHCNDSLNNNVFYRARTDFSSSGGGSNNGGNNNNNNNSNNSKNNKQLDALYSRWHRLTGPEYIREPLPTGRTGYLYYTPLSFRQGNLHGFDIIANQVAKFVPNGSKVCELYAGVGMLGLTSLAYHYNVMMIKKQNNNNNNEQEQQDQQQHKELVWLRCSDENPSNPKCFQRAVDSLPLEMTGRQSFLNQQQKKKFSSYRNKSSSSSIGMEDNDDDDDDENNMTLAELAKLMESGNNGNKKQLPYGASGSDSVNVIEKTSYMVASASLALLSGQALGANVLIVDPPRKGLEDFVVTELCKGINKNQPYVESTTFLSIPDEKVNWCNDVTTLIYVSCGFEAFTRDCERLVSSSGGGGWKLISATGYVLFPGSDHVETLAVFER